MSVTMAQYLIGIRERLSEPTASVWTDVQLRRWSQEVCRDMARRTKCFEKTTTQAVTANVRAYTAPTDLLVDGWKGAYFAPTGQSQMFKVEYRDISSLDHVWLQNQGVDTAAVPSYCTIWGVVPTASLLLYPVPSQAGTLTIYYHRLPVDAWAATAYATGLDSTALDIPEGYIDIIYDGVEYIALRQDQQARWQEVNALYEAKINAMIYNVASHSHEAQYVTPYRTPMPPSFMGYGGQW